MKGDIFSLFTDNQRSIMVIGEPELAQNEMISGYQSLPYDTRTRVKAKEHCNAKIKIHLNVYVIVFPTNHHPTRFAGWLVNFTVQWLVRPDTANSYENNQQMTHFSEILYSSVILLCSVYGFNKNLGSRDGWQIITIRSTPISVKAP